MNLLSYFLAIHHYSDVAGNDSRDTSFLCRVDNLVHCRNVLTVDDGVDREIGLYAVLIAGLSYLSEVADGECGCRVCTHIQLLNAEIDAVSSCIDGGSQ